ncbi:MAG: divalent metal cation transporter [Patescibacteria group bacterium]
MAYRRSSKKKETYWKKLGPGLVTGAADDDPSGIATYSQAGAQYRFDMLWLALFTFPFMLVAQEMCARIGLVTGKGLAANIRDHFSRTALIVCVALLVIANSFNIGADLAAMSQSIELIFPNAPYLPVVVLFGLGSLFLEIFMSYRTYAKYLKYLTLALFAYVITALLVDINWAEVLFKTFVPSIVTSREAVLLVAAILGTTISPYLFFWQPAQEMEEEIAEGRGSLVLREGATVGEIRAMRIDVASGMFFSNLIMFFIIAACGATLHAAGIFEITSAADAARALAPLAGGYAGHLFTLGIVGTGLLAIPVLAGSSAYAVAEALRSREGLSTKWYQARVFYGVIVLSVGFAIGINASGIDPFASLIYAAVGNAIVAPVILFFVMRLAASEKVMGKWKNSFLINVAGWLLVLLMGASSIAAIVALA